MAFAALTVDLNARIAQFEQDMARAGKSLDGLNNRANAAAAGLKSAFGALGATLTVGALASFAKSGIDAADALNDMSQRLKVSVKDLASFKLISEQSGTSLEGIGAGIGELTKSIGLAERGNKKMAAALTELGITARDPKEAFFQLADAVQRIEDPSTRAALLSRVLKGNYEELIPLLSQGSAALRESARQSETFADAMARLAPDADNFNDALTTMKIEAAGAAAQLLTKLVPGLSDTAREVAKLLDDDHGVLALGRALAGLGKIPFDILIGDPFKPADTAAKRIKELREELGQLQRNKASGNGLLLQKIFGTPEELDRQILVIKNQITALEKFGDKVYKPKTPAAAPGGDEQLQCFLKGGVWDGKKCQAKPDRTRAAAAKLDEIDPFASQRTAVLRDQEREQQRVSNFYIDQVEAENKAIFAQSDAWKQAQADLIAMVEPSTALVRKLTELDKLDGFVDPEVLAAARLEINAQIDALGKVGDKVKDLDVFGKKFAENTQDIFADFFMNFDQGTDGMLNKFGETIKGMIAEAAAADLSRFLFGDKIQGGKGGGALGGVFDIFGQIFGGARAGGGSVSAGVPYLVGERGPEIVVPRMSGTVIPNNRIGGMGGGATINVYVSGTNAPDVRRAAGQGAREALMAFNGAQRYA